MRIGIGVAWLVVVAAEMIALRSGLGYLIMDSRNAGNRYDLVIASMIIIGVIGLLLDGVTRLLERLKTGEVALCPLSKIVVSGVSKSFVSASGALPVIDGVSFSRRRRRVRRDRRAFGLRQVDADEHRRRLRAAPIAGTVTVDGVEHVGPSPKGIVISQHGSVFPWLTVQQNLMFGLNGDGHGDKAALADHYAAMVGLKGFEASYPHELSGGMLEARRAGARPRREARDPVHGRAVLGPRRADEPAHAQRAAAHPRRGAPHRAADHARRRGRRIYMADRIMVLSPRPATVQASFRSTSPRPRKLRPRGAGVARGGPEELGL
mgnify:CR=1 FL=1